MKTSAQERSSAHPVTPGEVLYEHYLKNLNITQERLAEALKVSRFTVNQIINGHRSVTADMALRLSHVLGTSPDFWLNLQQSVDIYEANLKLGDKIGAFEVLRRRSSGNNLHT